MSLAGAGENRALFSGPGGIPGHRAMAAGDNDDIPAAERCHRVPPDGAWATCTAVFWHTFATKSTPSKMRPLLDGDNVDSLSRVDDSTAALAPCGIDGSHLVSGYAVVDWAEWCKRY